MVLQYKKSVKKNNQDIDLQLEKLDLPFQYFYFVFSQLLKCNSKLANANASEHFNKCITVESVNGRKVKLRK